MKNVSEELYVGQKLMVKVLTIQGDRIRLSRKAVIEDSRRKTEPKSSLSDPFEMS